MSVLADVGERLVRHRLAAGLDLDGAAAATGIERERLGHAEDGAAALRDDEIARLSAAYGIDPTEVFGGRITPLQNYAGGA